MNRHLSTYEYLRVLEIEYIVCELRHKIYTRRKDKEYFKRVMKGKREKIEDICLRNCIPSIFSCEETRQECYSSVYREGGYPNFHYRNDLQRAEFEEKDIQNYYTLGSDMSVLYDDGTQKIGSLEGFVEANSVCYIKLKGESDKKPFLTSCVSRVV